MAFEDIKAGLEKYCKRLEEKLNHTTTQEDEEEKLAYVLGLIRKQSPRVPQNIVFDENYGQWEGRCYDCGQVIVLHKGCNYCSWCGHAIYWDGEVNAISRC